MCLIEPARPPKAASGIAACPINPSPYQAMNVGAGYGGLVAVMDCKREGISLYWSREW